MPPKSSWAVQRSLNRGRYNVAVILRRGFVRPIHRMGANGLIEPFKIQFPEFLERKHFSFAEFGDDV